MKITSFFAPKGGLKREMEKPERRKNDVANTFTSEHDNTTGSNKRPKRMTETVSTNEEAGCHLSEVQELLAFLKNDSSSDNEDVISWKIALSKHFASPQFSRLATFIAKERRSGPVYPTANNTWTALNACPLDRVKVVIVGQDPYHGPCQAHGLCFSVLPGVQVPPSLQNMYKELANDTKINVNFTPTTRPKHGHLIRWANQGVLLLNNVMTVRKGQPNSHQKKGWEQTTDEILKAVLKNNKGVVFLLWGKPAFQKADNVLTKYKSNKNVVVISTSHPSPLGATKTSSPFLTSKCFSRCNEALEKMGHTPIDWNVD